MKKKVEILIGCWYISDGDLDFGAFKKIFVFWKIGEIFMKKDV